MRYSPIEIIMGAMVLIVAIGFLILGMQSINNNQKDGYNISLIFGSTSGLKNGDDVKISGINVGKITKLDLNLEDYNAKVDVQLFASIKIILLFVSRKDNFAKHVSKTNRITGIIYNIIWV